LGLNFEFEINQRCQSSPRLLCFLMLTAEPFTGLLEFYIMNIEYTGMDTNTVCADAACGAGEGALGGVGETLPETNIELNNSLKTTFKVNIKVQQTKKNKITISSNKPFKTGSPATVSSEAIEELISVTSPFPSSETYCKIKNTLRITVNDNTFCNRQPSYCITRPRACYR
ncbi:hypothetical protein T4B_9436, partial [Trichinella pseudospiralis]